MVFIAREFWKAGHEATLNKMEAEAARVCVGLGVPHPFMSIESLTGSKEVWYINGFDSPEELAEVKRAYDTNHELTAAMARFSEQRAGFASQPSREALATYRPELSRGAEWRMGDDRFLVIAATNRGDLHREGTVFEGADGLRFVVIGAKTRREANVKLSAAGGEAKLFAVRPEFSMPAAEWIASDPSFWTLKARKK
jgi:hypothetical protein